MSYTVNASIYYIQKLTKVNTFDLISRVASFASYPWHSVSQTILITLAVLRSVSCESSSEFCSLNAAFSINLTPRSGNVVSSAVVVLTKLIFFETSVGYCSCLGLKCILRIWSRACLPCRLPFHCQWFCTSCSWKVALLLGCEAS